MFHDSIYRPFKLQSLKDQGQRAGGKEGGERLSGLRLSTPRLSLRHGLWWTVYSSNHSSPLGCGMSGETAVTEEQQVGKKGWCREGERSGGAGRALGADSRAAVQTAKLFCLQFA